MAENSMRTTLYSRNLFSPEEADLYELTQLAGVTIDAHVFKIITDLLRLNTHPSAIVRVSCIDSVCASKEGYFYNS